MNAILSLKELTKSTPFTATGAASQPQSVNSMSEQIAQLHRWTVVAALSSVLSAVCLLLA